MNRRWNLARGVGTWLPAPYVNYLQFFELAFKETTTTLPFKGLTATKGSYWDFCLKRNETNVPLEDITDEESALFALYGVISCLSRYNVTTFRVVDPWKHLTDQRKEECELWLQRENVTILEVKDVVDPCDLFLKHRAVLLGAGQDLNQLLTDLAGLIP